MVSLNSLQSVTNGNKLLMNSLVIKLLACIRQLTSRLNITLAKFQRIYVCSKELNKGIVFGQPFELIERHSSIHSIARPSPIRRLFPQMKKAEIFNQYCSPYQIICRRDLFCPLTNTANSRKLIFIAGETTSVEVRFRKPSVLNSKLRFFEEVS